MSQKEWWVSNYKNDWFLTETLDMIKVMCIELDQVKQELRLSTITQFLVLLTINAIHVYFNLWYLYELAFMIVDFLKY